MNNTVILIPTYNEKENIAQIIPGIFAFEPDVSVMVIDDNSPDGTAEEVEKMQQKYPKLSLYKRTKKEGLGRAYMDAFKKVLQEKPETKLICTMDADLSHDPKYLPNIFEATKKNDYIIGSRYVPGGNIVGWEFHRKLLSYLGNHYVRLVTRIPTHDCTSGFACISTNLLHKIDFSDFDTSGYAFLMYLKYKAWKNGARIHEVPICFKNRITGESKITMNIIQEGLLLPWRLIAKNKTNKSEKIICPQCKNKTGYYWFEKNKTKINKCKKCRLIFIYPIPNNLNEIYSENYFCGAGSGFGYINYDADKTEETEEFKKYLDKIENYYPNKGNMLDVGAATGSFLSAAKNRGWSVAGAEISEYAAEQGRKKGLDIKTGIIENCNFAPNTFDVITMWDVFEHLPDPDKTISYIYNLLKPNGLLVMNSPDAGSIYARIMGKHWALIIPPEHLHLFNKKNAETLLNKCGFHIETIGRIGKKFKLAYIFQILYTVHHNNIWKEISDWTKKTPLNKISFPINLHDNMFIITRKK